MATGVRVSTVADIQPLRDAYRREMSCQIVHDSLHVRPGWVVEYGISVNGERAGYGSVAIAGPWTGKPTVFEFYLTEPARDRAFELFESFLAVSGAARCEDQTNAPLLPVLIHAYGGDLATESIVFAEGATPHHTAVGVELVPDTDPAAVVDAIKRRRGGGEWRLEAGGTTVAKGGILFHYNEPYGDVYMEVDEPYRRRGYGSYLVQELKRICRELGAVPCARCNPANIASRGTLQKAGFVPVAAIITADLPHG